MLERTDYGNRSLKYTKRLIGGIQPLVQDRHDNKGDSEEEKEARARGA